MENNKFEKVIFILLRVFGVLAIIGGYLDHDGFFSNKELLILRHNTIIGNVYMISPAALVAMVVSIVLYLIFIRIISKHISITRKRV